MKTTQFHSLAASLVLVGALSVSGCATKKYVRQQVDPVTGRVQTVEGKTQENTANIGELKAGLSTTDERAQEAERLAKAAGTDAARANEGVTRVGQQAEQARQLAESGVNRAAGVERALENYSNFQQSTTESILFGFNKAMLTKEEKAKLDQLAQGLSSLKRYVVEVQGFTDQIGGAEYNVALSERRANAVVRYLATQHNIPLRNIHTLGVGKVEMAADAPKRQTREMRKMSRKVDVKVFVPSGQAAPAAGATT